MKFTLAVYLLGGFAVSTVCTLLLFTSASRDFPYRWLLLVPSSMPFGVGSSLYFLGFLASGYRWMVRVGVLIITIVPESLHAGESSVPFELRLSTDRTCFKRYEPITLVLSVRNISDQEHAFYDAQGSPLFYWVIVSDGKHSYDWRDRHRIAIHVGPVSNAAETPERRLVARLVGPGSEFKVEIPLSEGSLPYREFEFLDVSVEYPNWVVEEFAERKNSWKGKIASNRVKIVIEPHCGRESD